jgi:transcriptional regulator of heat shock response
MTHLDVKKTKSLTTRQKNLLFAVVKEYCDNNDSVGSKELKEKYGFDFSPATIRNELVVLRTEGYLYQPFTNSPSIPTELSLKLFINKLIEGLEFTNKSQLVLRQKVLTLQSKQTEMNKEIAKLVADNAGSIGFTVSSSGENIKGLSNLLTHKGDGKITDILNFLDNLDQHKQYLLNSHGVAQQLSTTIGDENPIIPLGKGYAMVTTKVTMQNGEETVVGMIASTQLLTQKNNLELMNIINSEFNLGSPHNDEKRKK